MYGIYLGSEGRRIYTMAMQIIILGPHRSGTSLLTRLVNMMGAYFGVGAASIGFNDENPKGFWERRDVIDVNDAILAGKGCSWEQLAAWKMDDAPPGKAPLGELDEIDHKIKNILLEMDANRPWVMKDPRLCLTYPRWKRHLEVPVLVMMTRDPLEVALSLKTRNTFPLHHGLAVWEYYTVGMVNAARELPVIRIRHRDILTRPYATVEALLEKLQKSGVDGLRLPKREEVEAFIEPTLYHSKSEGMNPEELLTSFQSALHATAEGEKTPPDTLLQPSGLARHIMEYRLSLEADGKKLLEANKAIAGLNQHLHEISSEMTFVRQKAEDAEIRLEKKSRESERLQRFIADMKDSASWKIGNAIARLFRAVTFTRRAAEEAPKSL